jgi:membrane-associated phospholipid phosphatase
VNPFCASPEKLRSLHRRGALGALLLLGVIAWQTPQALAQDTPASNSMTEPRPKSNDASAVKTSVKKKTALVPDESSENTIGLQLIKNIAQDQRALWTSPSHLRLGNADWLVPFAGITVELMSTDQSVIFHESNSPSTLKKYQNLSNYGIAGMAGAVGGMYLWGRATHDPHKREAGILSGEAALNALLMTTALKYATGRERPTVDYAAGKFWWGGDSFPSDHAATAWAMASVLTHEYLGPLTKILAYGAATAISLARVRAKDHFPSDVFVGAGIGWLTGWQIYRTRHNSEVGGGVPEVLSGSPIAQSERTTGAMGSPYVQLDSWIYPLFDRLIAMGAMDDAILGMKPWTRLECARLLNEAEDRFADADEETQPARLYKSLRQEFAPELKLLEGGSNTTIRLESVYTRFTEISGPPLTDGFHFGQTLYNDFGRPFEQGFNSVAGFSGWATAGRWVVYARGEYQHAPSGTAIPAKAETVIANVDAVPFVTPTPAPERNQATLLDAYVGFNLGNWLISFGQESMWWGPGASGPLLFSDNAPPVQMFHIDRVSPFRLPWIFKLLGPARWNLFFGRLQGHLLSPNPFFHGEKMSFKPTRNLEFGFTRTVVVGGEGRPLTPYRLYLTYFSATSYLVKPANKDPGKRDGGFDFTYRVPWLRNWLTIYNDSISADDVSPLAAPRRAGISPGLYLTHFPRFSKLDLRVEAPLTDTVVTDGAGRYIYWDNYYRDLYTNRKVLMGNWVGRDGQAIQATSRYWLSARSSLQFGYRHEKIDVKYLPGGGTINDASVRAEFQVGREWSASTAFQYEQWQIPLLAPNLQRNVSASFQLVFWPQPRSH